jgi:hypothetical protein
VDNIWQWFQETETTAGGITDKIRVYLTAQGYTGATNDAMYNWLGGLGYSGALPDRIKGFEDDSTDRN